MSGKDYQVPQPGYKDYVPPVSAFWWVKYRPYFFFMLREMSSLFVLLIAVWLLSALIALSTGEAAWNNWIAKARDSTSMGIAAILAFFFILFHSITWFQAGAVVSPLEIGEFKVPSVLFVLANVGLVVVVTVVIGYFSLGG